MFVYGAPVVEDRPQVWSLILDLLAIAPNCLIIGDINQIEHHYDRLGGSNVIQGWDSFIDFRLKSCLFATPFKGPAYTWTNNRDADQLILQRLDRAYMTSDWFQNFPESRLINQPILISDQAAIFFDDFLFTQRSNRPYQLDNWFLDCQDIHDFVLTTWQRHTSGSPMFILSKNLQHVKSLVRNWCLNNKKFWGVDWNFFSKELSNEGELIHSINDASLYLSSIVTSKESILLQLQFWRQRCKKNWILKGDCPSKLLFSKVKCRQKKNEISSLLDDLGVLQHGHTDVQHVVVQALKKTFKTDNVPLFDPEIDTVLQELDLPRFNSSQIANLERPFTASEIRIAMFSLGNCKSHRPDRMTVEFFKTHWNVVGDSVVSGIQSIFQTGFLLKEWNQTLLVMILKISNPTEMGHLRPISLCNTVYKCASKCLVARLRQYVPVLISDSKHAFV
ncbi:uncharacterized protein LOC110685287 [Chenopodium quinoa]|uniref:uncharacterized protein LOC110685287 n=1 Tax=Chenopodium quinoa TaxID=63459 RepID=UPI000B796F3C|nr:uncharacterized protein LOC110685287 [Chenopodium quinoa]